MAEGITTHNGPGRIRYCLIAFIVATSVQLIFLVSLVVHWRTYREGLLAPKQQILCYAWDRFITTDGDRFITTDDEEECPDDLSKKFGKRQNTTLCCGDASVVLNQLVTKAVYDKYDSNVNPELIRSTLDLKDYECERTNKKQPIAKLVDVDRNKTTVSVGESSKILWNSDSPSYAKSGLTYLEEEGSIYVETNGFYYVFSQIKLRLESTNDTGERTFRHCVHLISREGTRSTVLEDARTPCEMASKTAESTSVVGAVFRLEEGDKLYVATSHPAQLIPDHHSNYFSMHGI